MKKEILKPGCLCSVQRLMKLEEDFLGINNGDIVMLLYAEPWKYLNGMIQYVFLTTDGTKINYDHHILSEVLKRFSRIRK